MKTNDEAFQEAVSEQKSEAKPLKPLIVGNVSLLYEFVGWLSIEETLPPTRAEAYPWMKLVENFLRIKEASKSPEQPQESR